MMRISSSDTNGTKGVCFCPAVFKKLARKLDPRLTHEERSTILMTEFPDPIWVKEMLKSNQTRYGVSHGYLDCKQKEFLGLPCLGKKLVLHTETCDYFESFLLTNFEKYVFLIRS